MKNKITEMLNIKYPVIQGGMYLIADAELAAAVSNGGGLGLIASASRSKDDLRNEIRKAKSLTDKPFGVNILLLESSAADMAQVVAEEGVKVVTTGAGSPGKYMNMWKEAGITVIPVVPSVALAKKVEALGADAVIVEGTEAGGHIGEITNMSLIPQVCDAVDIPVIAAGGIADGRGLAAAFALGAQGVQIGTGFLVAEECNIHKNYKDFIVNAKDTDTIVTGRNTGKPVRSLKSSVSREYLELEKQNASYEELHKLMDGAVKKAIYDGNLDEGSFIAGQIAGLVNKIQPASRIIEEMFSNANLILSNIKL